MAKKILIIEDEEFLVDLYKLKLEKEGYEVSAAFDGEEGLAKVAADKPDLILLDLLLPKLDGYKVLQKLKEDDKTKDIKICILTNFSQYSQDESKSLAKADRQYIKAHITPGQLVEDLKDIF